jgi:hypothetical protein
LLRLMLALAQVETVDTGAGPVTQTSAK